MKFPSINHCVSVHAEIYIYPLRAVAKPPESFTLLLFICRYLVKWSPFTTRTDHVPLPLRSNSVSMPTLRQVLGCREVQAGQHQRRSIPRSKRAGCKKPDLPAATAEETRRIGVTKLHTDVDAVSPWVRPRQDRLYLCGQPVQRLRHVQQLDLENDQKSGYFFFLVTP